MSHLLQILSSPSQTAAPTVLLEGKPVVVVTSQNGNIPEGSPTILAEGKPVAVQTLEFPGAATVLADSES